MLSRKFLVPWFASCEIVFFTGRQEVGMDSGKIWVRGGGHMPPLYC
jgi:hypothetical protein